MPTFRSFFIFEMRVCVRVCACVRIHIYIYILIIIKKRRYPTIHGGSSVRAGVR